MSSVGNLSISGASLSKLALPNIKYKYAVECWSQMYWLFVYATKYIFSWTTIVKPQAQTCETLVNVPTGCIPQAIVTDRHVDNQSLTFIIVLDYTY